MQSRCCTCFQLSPNCRASGEGLERSRNMSPGTGSVQPGTSSSSPASNQQCLHCDRDSTINQITLGSLRTLSVSRQNATAAGRSRLGTQTPWRNPETRQRASLGEGERPPPTFAFHSGFPNPLAELVSPQLTTLLGLDRGKVSNGGQVHREHYGSPTTADSPAHKSGPQRQVPARATPWPWPWPEPARAA